MERFELIYGNGKTPSTAAENAYPHRPQMKESQYDHDSVARQKLCWRATCGDADTWSKEFIHRVRKVHSHERHETVNRKDESAETDRYGRRQHGWSGVFSLPARFGVATGILWSLIAWPIAGADMLMLTFIFQNLAIHKPQLDSGVFIYAKERFGDYFGFSSAIGYWASSIAGDTF